ncbi:hypothetical protein [Colwellia sp. E2M01]|uniref:DUF6933 domain-containing protein n=1 Tax=Colwellia sp. E2M01 TaxID=2841561 RepID=UPI001C08E21F|nr:hypothetical protein [Colwellia sp. E2M01]MBU2871112.1 hypothetical protein [Colwellia sp. E2M01]
MLVFNCTKAAADFFTTTKNGNKFSCIEPAPEKNIPYDDIKPANVNVLSTHTAFGNTESPWQWLVHVVKVKRKNIVIVMDCHSRFSMTFSGIKKGDELAFLNMFEHHITLHITQMMSVFADIPGAVEEDVTDEIFDSIECYNNMHTNCAFHQRGDRSVQATLNDVVWHFEQQAHEFGYIAEDFGLIKFDDFINQMLRKNKSDKQYFSPHHRFLKAWLTDYTDNNTQEIARKITDFKAIERSIYQEIKEHIEYAEHITQNKQDVENTEAIPDNVISLDSYREKQS